MPKWKLVFGIFQAPSKACILTFEAPLKSVVNIMPKLI